MKILVFFISFLLLLGDSSRAAFSVGSSSSSASASVLTLSGASSTGITYDSTKVEFTAGSAKLKNQYGDDAYFVATYSTSKNANYSKLGGSLTATSSGTSSITSDKLVFSSGSSAYVSYNPLGNFPIGQSYSLKFKYTPGYTTDPVVNQHIFCSARTDTDGAWSLFINHGGGTKNATYHAETNSAIKAYSTVWNGASSGVENEFLAVTDWTNAVYRLYIDGVLIGSPPTGSSTRDSIGRILRVGQDHDNNAGDIANFSIRDLIIYSGVHQSGAYTPGYTLTETPYLTTDPTIKNTTQVTAASYVSFTTGTTVAGSDAVKYQIEVGGQAKYWNGSAWANSDGTYAQSNTAAEINTNCPTLAAGATRIVAVLRSADGSTTPALAYASLTYR